MHISRILLWVLIFSLVASGAVGIAIFLFADFNPREMKILFSTLDIGACSLAGLCCATIWETRYKWFSILGISIVAITMSLLLYTIWWWERLENFNLVLTFVILSATCSHIALTLLTQTPTRLVSWVLGFTVFFIAVLGVMLIVLVWHDDISEAFYRLLGVCGILDVLGTIISPILSRTQRFEDVMEDG